MKTFNGLSDNELAQLKQGFLDIFQDQSATTNGYSDQSLATRRLAAANAGAALVELQKLAK